MESNRAAEESYENTGRYPSYANPSYPADVLVFGVIWRRRYFRRIKDCTYCPSSFKSSVNRAAGAAEWVICWTYCAWLLCQLIGSKTQKLFASCLLCVTTTTCRSSIHRWLSSPDGHHLLWFSEGRIIRIIIIMDQHQARMWRVPLACPRVCFRWRLFPTDFQNGERCCRQWRWLCRCRLNRFALL